MSGPLSIQELLAVWQSAVDSGYGDAFVNADEGKGLETYTQGFAQLQRVSQAIDTTTQAMYILPWSGQTAPPAAGETAATVKLTFARTKLLEQPLRLGAGQVFYEEVTNDWGQSEPTPVHTGRRYTLQADLIFLPGESGPFEVDAIAEKIGYGYNNPLPGAINFVSQPGTAFYHDRATVSSITPLVLVTVNEADTFVPDHVGQYVMFTAGSNDMAVARVVGFSPPNLALTPPIGSTVTLERLIAIESFTAPSGTFHVGDAVAFYNGIINTATGTLVAFRAAAGAHVRYGVLLDDTSGTSISVGETLVGPVGAAASVDHVLMDPAWVTESGTASWRVLDWVADWGLTVTNKLSPAGGCTGMLDAIGFDRNVPRLQGEQDDVYRQRIHQVADVVTPNAIRRALNRTLGAIPWCFREVGTALLPGFYYDEDAYDTDVLQWNATQPSTTTAGAVLADSTAFVVTSAPALLNPKFIQLDSEIMWVQQIIGNNLLVQRGVMGTTPAFHAMSTVVNAVFEPNERVNYVDATGLIKATGYFGSYAAGKLTMIRLQGDPTFASGDQIIGLNSNATYTATSQVTLTTPTTLRFHFYLDYTSFRAYFMVGVPRVGYNETGFGWAPLPAGSPASPYSFFDAAPFPDFYDGFATGSGAFYRRVWQAVEKVRAAGVSWDLYREDGSCS